MKLFIYDTEVFRYDWLSIFKCLSDKTYTIIHNDNEEMQNFLKDEADSIFIGFNTKHYDQFILKGIVAGMTTEELKELNDYIIVQGNQGWSHPVMRDTFFRINNVDLMDDMQKGLSLKAIEGHIGMNIQETEVDFNLDRPLTEEELQQTIHYCKHDVDATEQIFLLRKKYLENKLNIGRLAGIDDAKALSMTNAKLTASLLKAEMKPHDDEREYQYPTNLLRDYIPEEVFKFFDKMHDKSLSDDEVFKDKLNIEVGGCPVTIAYGGIHGAKKAYIFEKDHEHERHRVIENDDVGSYYPHLMTINGYTSRNIPDPKIFENVLEDRMKAKKAGDTATANALKLVVNTTYGASLNQYNDLFDPLMGHSVCVSGQLYLLELAEHLVQTVKELEVIQLNTDGIMVEFWNEDQDTVTAIMKEWQDRTGFSLEADQIDRIYQKDVNNYMEVQPDGKVKAKGGYLVKGIAPAGAFNINNNACIVATAIKEWFLKGTPPEATVNACDDITQFQMIAKAGAKYKESYYMVNGQKVQVQKVNRVYASSDERYGKLYKVKLEDDSEAKIDSLPEHCAIDNDNHLTIVDVDKSFYIEMAKKRINDFCGIKPEKIKKGRTKTMATQKTESIYKRLSNVRIKFLEAGVKRTGKNMTLKSKYFDLDDIVPVSMPLFNEQELFPKMDFMGDNCILHIIDMNDPAVMVDFTAPMEHWQGNAAVTPVQALGANITYMRRYLYQVALDIVEADEIETSFTPKPVSEGTVDTTPVSATVPATAIHAPVSQEKREEVRLNLTNPDGKASTLQIKQLKENLKKLRAAFPDGSKEEYVAGIAVESNGFTNITKTRCEEVITEVQTMLKGDNA